MPPPPLDKATMPANVDPDPTDDTLPTPEEAILRATDRERGLLRTLRNSRVLFYPGAGRDISPALRFAEIGAIDTVLYCDYINRVPRAVFDDLEMRGRFHGREARDVHASELGQRCRADFFPALQHRWGRRDDDEANPVIGGVMEMRSYGPDAGLFTFIYLDTEAIQTYIHVWGVAGDAPLIVVVQNHGFGGLWTSLGGDCLMYTAAPLLPFFFTSGISAVKPGQTIGRFRERLSMLKACTGVSGRCGNAHCLIESIRIRHCGFSSPMTTPQRTRTARRGSSPSGCRRRCGGQPEYHCSQIPRPGAESSEDRR